jgi:predicted GNAT family acetyltransferase
MTDMPVRWKDNEALHRFEWTEEEGVGFIDYHRAGTRVTLVHTEIPPVYRGKGEGSEFVEATLRYIDQKGWTIVPLCNFVQSYLKAHPEWTRLVDKHVRIK